MLDLSPNTPHVHANSGVGVLSTKRVHIIICVCVSFRRPFRPYRYLLQTVTDKERNKHNKYTRQLQKAGTRNFA